MARDFSVKVRLTEIESEYINKQVEKGVAVSRSEYIRDLLKQDMKKNNNKK